LNPVFPGTRFRSVIRRPAPVTFPSVRLEQQAFVYAKLTTPRGSNVCHPLPLR
jgi:hypothetical protein